LEIISGKFPHDEIKLFQSDINVTVFKIFISYAVHGLGLAVSAIGLGAGGLSNITSVVF